MTCLFYFGNHFFWHVTKYIKPSIDRLWPKIFIWHYVKYRSHLSSETLSLHTWANNNICLWQHNTPHSPTSPCQWGSVSLEDESVGSLWLDNEMLSWLCLLSSAASCSLWDGTENVVSEWCQEMALILLLDNSNQSNYKFWLYIQHYQ